MLRDKAEAVRRFVSAARLGLQLHNFMAEVKMRAERKAGQFLGGMKLRGGDRRSKGHHVPVRLADLEITPQQSKRWQRMAAVPEAVFEQYLRLMNEQNREVTSAGLLRFAGQSQQRGKRVGGEPQSNAAVRATDSVSELLDELTNHCRLLDEILRPVYEGNGAELTRGEKRFVGQLITEMGDQLKQLKKLWPGSSWSSS